MHFITIYILFILKCFPIRVWVPERDKRLIVRIFGKSNNSVYSDISKSIPFICLPNMFCLPNRLHKSFPCQICCCSTDYDIVKRTSFYYKFPFPLVNVLCSSTSIVEPIIIDFLQSGQWLFFFFKFKSSLFGFLGVIENQTPTNSQRPARSLLTWR